MTVPTIYAAMNAVMVEVSHVAKRDYNDHQRFNFRGIDAVVNAVGPALRNHGVIVAPQVISAAYDNVQTSTGKPATACRVRVAYIFYGPTGDSIETNVVGEAWDSGDKAAPKAMSVAFRTALLQALALPTDEPDPDTHTYERAHQPAPPPPVNLRDVVWAESKKRDPELDDEQRKAWIRGELSALGGDSDDHMRDLLRAWAS